MLASRRLPFLLIAIAALGAGGASPGLASDLSVAADLLPPGSTVVVNELHVDPDVKTELVEFVELHNSGQSDVDLSGWRFTEGVFYTFPAGTILPAEGYIIVAQDPQHIQAKWTTGRLAISAGRVFGPFAGKLDNDGDHVVLCDAQGQVIDEVEYQLGFPWPTVGDAVSVPGTGCSMQLVHPWFDNNLGGSWRSALPTPAEVNTGVLSENIPPHIRQVTHSPRQPTSGDAVMITAKVTDPNGVADVTLLYQVVRPGDYISRLDARYASQWVPVQMHDDGLDGDVLANDDVFTVVLPPALSVHRTLIRYRILVADSVGNVMLVPYPDDPQPNFAYFVYDGVPAWRGAVRPGVTPVIEFPAEVMRSLPVYHLISKKSDVENATWLQRYGLGQAGRKDFNWYGTLVYDGEVYDHVRYRMRGGVWRYAMGKNMWKFDFHRGHYFQAHDDYGRPYGTKWDKLNFSACIQQGSFGQRGEQGMFEAVSFRLFNLASCPASKTNYIHFRIVDESYEDGERNAAHSPLTTKGTQYDGDFWGLYMTIEQMDGRFLDEHGLPDGNLYKMDNNNDDQNNQGPTQPSDWSDLRQFVSGYSNANEPWWRQNVNLDAYYAYHAIYQAIHHGDITEKNWFLYHHPETNQWWQLPWDLDLTWTTYYGSNDPSDPFRRSGVLNYNSIDIANRNRLREVSDLLFNMDQTGQLIDEYATIIDNPPGGLSMVDADRAMWDYHWVVGNAAYPKYIDQPANNKAGQGRFYQEAVDRGYERTFEGMVQVMKDYILERLPHMRQKAADSAIPNTPTVTATGPQDFPANALTFRTSPFNDPQGAHTFGAMKWRIAEVAVGSRVPVGPDPGTVLLSDGAVWKYFKGLQEPSATQGAWRMLGFDDSQWLTGSAPIGYGESFIATWLGDMRNNYTTVYLRNILSVANLDDWAKLVFEIQYDDGVNLWINGKLAYRANVASAEMPYNGVAAGSIENTNFVRQELGDPRTWLKVGTNIIAAQVLNHSISTSSDCFFDLRLTGEKAQTGGVDDEPVTPPVYRREPGKYEIEAAWESAELTAFSSDVKIPASAVRAGRTYRVRCRMKDNTGRWSHWSDPVQFVAGEPIAAGILSDLRVTEVMYDPAVMADDTFDNQEYEYIELKNTGDEILDLRGVSLTGGITFEFQSSAVTDLGPGRFVLVVKNQEAFLGRYGVSLSGLIAGEYSGKLANDGENVLLADYWNGTIAEFEYGDGRGWPVAADGGGHSLVPSTSAIQDQPQGSLNYPGNWRASTYLGGSPGQNDPEPLQTVVLNELVTNPGDDAGSSDWVELYNPTSSNVSLSQWYLSDDVSEPMKYAPGAISIPAGGRLVLTNLKGFGLSRDGEDLALSYLPGTAQDRIVDAVSFGAQETGISLGRYPDGGPYWFRMVPSQGKANTKPITDIMMTEIMYHPVDANEEYIELYNPTTEAVDLATESGLWRLSGGVDYSFPAGTSIPAGGRLVLVGFDPQVETSRLAAFRAAYDCQSLVAGVTVLGPWQGNLANEGERVGLEKALADSVRTDDAGWVIVDEVLYGDVPPWPREPDGYGPALQRIRTEPSHSGNDPANWQAALPTPGS